MWVAWLLAFLEAMRAGPAAVDEPSTVPDARTSRLLFCSTRRGFGIRGPRKKFFVGGFSWIVRGVCQLCFFLRAFAFLQLLQLLYGLDEMLFQRGRFRVLDVAVLFKIRLCQRQRLPLADLARVA